MPSLSVAPCTFALFGALGDLALRKLFPALYQLDCAGLLHADTEIFALARDKGDADAHLAVIDKHLRHHLPAAEQDEQVLQRFQARLRYLSMEFLQLDSYQPLAEAIKAKQQLIA